MNQTSLTAAPDADLVVRARDGDRDAYGILVARHQSLVCAVTLGVCGDLGRSEDLAQDVFLAAWHRLATLRDPVRFRSWICSIARHVAVDEGRRARRGVAAGSIDDVAEPPSAESMPDRAAVRAEERALVVEALAALPAPYREVLALFYREDQSVPQVATALELSEDAVKQRLARGRAMLRERVVAIVGSALQRTRPGTAFTVAVVATLPALAPPAAAATIGAAVKAAESGAGPATGLAASSALWGPLLGVLGAWIGVRASVAATRSPRERAYAVRLAKITLLETGAFVVALCGAIWFGRALLPEHAGGFAAIVTALVVAHAAALVVLIVRGNRMQKRIRREDGTEVAAMERAAGACASASRTGAAAAGGLAGAVIGSTAWLVVSALLAQDWLAFSAIVAATGVILAAALLAVRRWRHRYDAVVAAAFVAIAVLSFVVVQLRWTAWVATPGVAPFVSGWPLPGGWTLAAIDALLAVVFGVLLLVFVTRAWRSHRAAG